MKTSGFLVAGGATFVLIASLLGAIWLGDGVPFSPGALGSAHAHNQSFGGVASHAELDARCELCHVPFRGPQSSRCLDCHADTRNQITSQGMHAKFPNAQQCVACHTEHKGRAANLTSVSLIAMPHDQFGFSLFEHQRDYKNTAITCRGCHTFANEPGKPESIAVTAACVDCHTQHDAWFIAEHRRSMGEACLACHDGTKRLQGFEHNTIFALNGKHGQVACVKCHVNNQFRGTPRGCVNCHAEPAVHRGKYGTKCEVCHTSAGWRPARLFDHPFPLDHSGKQSGCTVCHPTSYTAYTCYNCHEHNAQNISRLHRDANIREFQDCTKCHRTGKRSE